MKVASFLVLSLCAVALPAQQLDPLQKQLFSELTQIRAIDNHTHVGALMKKGQVDYDQDALPCPTATAGDAPFLARPAENARYPQASHALFGYRYNDYTPQHLQKRNTARDAVLQMHGDAYPAWILDHVGTDVMLANRISLGRGLTSPRFLWVAFDDALMYPLDNSALKSETPDRAYYFTREEELLCRYQSDLAVQSLPPTLDEYLRLVVLPKLAQQKQNGAVAIKFEAAYLRSLDFSHATKGEVEGTYARFIHGGLPDGAEYRKLQDFLVRSMAVEAGRLKWILGTGEPGEGGIFFCVDMAVHFHTGGGCGTYFNLRGSDPSLLQSLFNDASLRKTNFVMLHGGNSVGESVPFLIGMPNVYVDFSAEVTLLSASKLASILRQWIDAFPEKVLFGSDVFPEDEAPGWEEQAWVAGHNGRVALAIALAGMMRDSEITHARAIQIAHSVLHDNAAKLYSLPR